MHPSPEVVQIGKKIRELREQLTKARRAAEPEPVADYTFTSPDGDPVTLASLFGSGPDLLVVHNMGRSCPYCTLWADGFVGFAGHLADRARFVLSSPDQPAELKEFAQSRGWNYPVVSHAGTTFAKDMGFEPEPGKFMPGVSQKRRRHDRAHGRGPVRPGRRLLLGLGPVRPVPGRRRRLGAQVRLCIDDRHADKDIRVIRRVTPSLSPRRLGYPRPLEKSCPTRNPRVRGLTLGVYLARATF